MQIELTMSKELENKISHLVLSSTNKALSQQNNPLTFKEWMSLNEAAKYASVSNNTFSKFREMGLKVCQLDGVKRVSRKEIDRFLENNSF